jgi:hypothetical protein
MWPNGKISDLRDPGLGGRPPHFTYPRTKVRAFNEITYYHQLVCRNQDRCVSNVGVSLHCFTAHPGMGGESCHYTHLTVHCLSTITLEGGYDKTRIPQSWGFGLIRSTSTRPRRPAQFDREGRSACHFVVSSLTSPSCLGTADHF